MNVLNLNEMCLGKNNFVLVKINGNKEHNQKRFLLCNLKGLHIGFLKWTLFQIGLSKFCQLRRKLCVTIHSASGLHSVCNCEIHHNVKLLTTAIPGNFDNKQLLPELVCDLNKRECMFHNCDLCPGVEKLGEHIKDMFTKAHIDDDIVSFK